MRCLPAIDLKNGRCVRLTEGRLETAKVYSDDPGAQARAFVAAGARWIHVVDLDGAFEGTPGNREAIGAILRAGARVQLGGGLRNLEEVDGALDAGAERIVIGTAAVTDPAFLREACLQHPGRILVAVDARGGQVAVEGWARASGQTVQELASRAHDAGAAGLLYTDITRDGTVAGVNVAATAELARESGLPVVASGGVRSLEDLESLEEHPGIEGAIVGRAVYEGALDLEQALARHDASSLYPD